MRHLVSGRKLKRTHSHRIALMKNMATSLFEHKRIETTEAKAKELRPYAESLITKAKVALAREKQGLLPDGQKIDVHSRRIVGRHIQNKAVLQELFDAIAPVVESRNGGYTRIIKTHIRRGDAGRAAIIELVDWSAPQDGLSSLKGKKKKVTPKKVAPKAEVVATPAPVVEAPIEEVAPIVEEVLNVVEETPVVEATNEEAPKLSFEDTASEDKA